MEIDQQHGWMMKWYLCIEERGQTLPCDTGTMPQPIVRGDTLKLYPASSNYVFPDRTLHELALMNIISLVGEEWYHIMVPADE